MATRPAETSRLRRLLMQSIMWLILAATIGLATLVDAHKTRRSTVTLGQAQQIDNISLRFPADWEIVEGSDRLNPNAALELRDSADGSAQRTIDVRLGPISFLDAFGLFQKRPAGGMSILFGDTPAVLYAYREVNRDAETGGTYFVLRCDVSRPLNDGRTLLLQIARAGVDGAVGQRGQNEDIELIRKIAATLTIQSK